MVTTFNPTIIMLKHIICIAGLALALASCEKIEKVEAPVFSVTTEKDTYAAGESVKFFFHGNPDIISCYTGELGNNYDYTDGRIAEPDFLITFDQQHSNSTSFMYWYRRISTKTTRTRGSLRPT